MSKKNDVAAAISRAALAYQAGEVDFVERRLHADVHVVGSEAKENWRGLGQAKKELKEELANLDKGDQTVRGDLVKCATDAAVIATDVKAVGDIAWWSCTAAVELDNIKHNEGSWSVVLERDHDGDWKIVHSHFSIHRGPKASPK